MVEVEIGEHDNRTSIAYGKHAMNLIYDSSTMIIGSDVLAQFILAGLAGFGVRKGIYIVDNKRISRKDKNDFLCLKEKGDKIYVGTPKIEYLAETLRKINPSSNIVERFFKFNEGFLYRHNPQIVVDATNDPLSKEDALEYARKYGKPFISVSSDETRGIISVHKWDTRFPPTKSEKNLESIVHAEFEGKYQGNFTSGVIAGLALEEIRKFIFKISEADGSLPNDTPLVYNVDSITRRGTSNNLKLEKAEDLRKFYALVIGAGGTGTYVALNLALMGIGNITILDPDTIKGSNLNRQILYYDTIENHKAEVLAQRLLEINPNVKFRKSLLKIDKEKENIFKYGIKLSEKDHKKYDIVFGCTDNREARLITDEFCVKYKIPYIDGAVSPTSGKVVAYVPNKTPPISEQTTYPEGTISCDQAAPSVVMSNMIIGSAMAAEAVKVLNFHRYKENPINGILKYEAKDHKRIFVSGS